MNVIKSKILMVCLTVGVAQAAVLPEGYVEAEYIESTGSEFIKTGVVPVSTTRFVVDCQFLRFYADLSQAMGWGSATEQLYLSFGKAGALYGDSCANWTAVPLGAHGGFVRAEIDARGSGEFYVDGELVVTASGIGDEATKFANAYGGLYLFARNENASYGATRGPSTARLWGCRIYDGEAEVRNFVPCYDTANGRYGLCDVLTGKFYGNDSGKGAFKGKLKVADAVREPLGEGDWSRFKYESEIVFTDSQTGGLRDFPVMLRISAANPSGFDYADCAADGTDLAFALVQDGTWLDYEVETWNPGGASVVWLKVPALSSLTKVRMYWGLKDGEKAGAYAGSAIWSAAGFSTVLHMNDVSGRDATGGSAFGTSAGVALQDGKVGKCLKTASQTDRMIVKYADGAPWATALVSPGFTLSFWLNVAERGTDWPYFLQWSREGNVSGPGIWVGGSMCEAQRGNTYGTAFWIQGNGSFGAVTQKSLGDLFQTTWSYAGNWEHFTIACEKQENGQLRVCTYLNGTRVSDKVVSIANGASTWVTQPPTATDLSLLNPETSVGNCSSKVVRMDEFRLSSGFRGDEWVSATYRTMASDAFCLMGARATASAPAGSGDEVNAPTVALTAAEFDSAVADLTLSWNVIESGDGCEAVDLYAVYGLRNQPLVMTNELVRWVSGAGTTTLHGLMPGRAYDVELLAVNEAGGRASSGKLTAIAPFTDEDPSAPLVAGWPVLAQAVAVDVPEIFPSDNVTNLTVTGSLLAAGSTEGVSVTVEYTDANGEWRSVPATVEGLAFRALIPTAKTGSSMQFRVRATNAIGEDVLAQRTKGSLRPVADIVYVWKTSVVKGGFRDAENWRTTDVPNHGYPATATETANFAQLGTTDDYCIRLDADVTCKGIGNLTPYARISFVGERPGLKLTAAIGQIPEASRLTVSNLTIEAFADGLNSRVELRQNARVEISEAGRLNVWGCSLMDPGCSMHIAGSGRMSINTSLNMASSVELLCEGQMTAGDIIYQQKAGSQTRFAIAGTNALVTLWRDVANNSPDAVTIDFRVPAEGFVRAASGDWVAPLAIQLASDQECLFPSAKSVGTVGVRVAGDSPVLKAPNRPNRRIVPLVSMKGLAVGKIAYAEMPKANRGDRFVTLYDRSAETSGTLPTGIAAELRAGAGLSVIVR